MRPASDRRSDATLSPLGTKRGSCHLDRLRTKNRGYLIYATTKAAKGIDEALEVLEALKRRFERALER